MLRTCKTSCYNYEESELQQTSLGNKCMGEDGRYKMPEIGENQARNTSELGSRMEGLMGRYWLG